MIHAYQLVVLAPYAAALILVAIPGYRVGAVINVLASAATLAAGLWLMVGDGTVGTYAIVDEFNVVFIVINTLVGFTTALFSASYIGHEIETGRLSPGFVRFYHAMFQAMMGSMNVALVANNIGVMWVGLELATLITVVMVGLYRTPQAIEAAWKYFILASVGISLAFFGTILIYLAGQPALGEGMPAMTWSLLQGAAAQMDPAILDLAFIFLLIGYGTKVGLAPLHAWLPDAHAEGPTPISAVLSGLLLNVALYALLRFKMLVAGQPAALDPGPVMIVMGLVSLIFAAFMLYQRRDIKRFFAYSSIEHMGLIVFAFGMGGPLANFAGLLHMAMHSLTKSGIFFAVGHIAQAKGSQRFADIAGLSVTHPRLAVAFALAVVAIAGLPPFGVFTSEFLILTTTFAREPWLALLPAFGLLDRLRRVVAALAGHDLRRAGGARPSRRRLVGAAGPAPAAGAGGGHLPAAGPGRLVPARRGAARMSAVAALALADLVGDRPASTDGYVRLAVDADTWMALAEGCAAGHHDLGALWADDGRMCLALSAPSRGLRAIVSFETDAGRYPSVAARHLPALRLERAARDLYGVQPIGLPDTRPWLDHGRWPGRQSEARYEFLPVEGEGLHQIPVGPVHAGIIEPGHFRFTANGETVVRLEERLGYVHKGVEGLMAGAEVERAMRIVGRISGDSTVAYAWAFARAVEAALHWSPPPRALLLRGDHGRAGAAGAPYQRCRRDLQRRQRAHDPRPLHPAARGRAGGGQRLLRPSLDDGLRRAGRRRRRPDARRRRPDSRPHAAFRGHARRDPAGLRFDAVAAGSHRHDRLRRPRACPPVRGGRLCRPRFRPRLRRPQGLRLCALRPRGFRPQGTPGGRRRCAPDGAPRRDR